MTTDQHERDTYEERLLSELRAYVAERPRSGTPVAVQRRRRLPKLALAGAATAAVVGGVVIATGGDGASAAYAVEAQGDGSVTVEIRKLEDADGLQAKLREAGVPAVVKYLPIGKTCKQGWFEPANDPGQRTSLSGTTSDGGQGKATFTIDPGTLRPGQTVVITTSTGSAPAPAGVPAEGNVHMTAVGMAIADGPVGECEVVDGPLDDPAPMPIGAGGGSIERLDGRATPENGAEPAATVRVEHVEQP
jgi:hypothetical protein